jgi:hypothetical protein
VSRPLIASRLRLHVDRECHAVFVSASFVCTRKAEPVFEKQRNPIIIIDRSLARRTWKTLLHELPNERTCDASGCRAKGCLGSFGASFCAYWLHCLGINLSRRHWLQSHSHLLVAHVDDSVHHTPIAGLHTWVNQFFRPRPWLPLILTCGAVMWSAHLGPPVVMLFRLGGVWRVHRIAVLIDGVTQLARVAFLWGQVDVGDGMRIAQYPPGDVPLDIAILWGVIVLFSGLCFTLRVRKTLVCYGGILAVQSGLTLLISAWASYFEMEAPTARHRARQLTAPIPMGPIVRLWPRSR